MLAHLIMAATHLLDVSICQTDYSTEPEQHHANGENAFTVDLSALRSLILPISDNAWFHTVNACHKAINPIYTNMHQTLSSDLENVAQILFDLETRSENIQTHDEDCNTFTSSVYALNNSKPMAGLSAGRKGLPQRELSFQSPGQRKRRSTHSYHLVSHPIVIPSSNPLVPSIAITLAPPQPREMSCRVPYQDHAFGNLLTIPSHPAFNKIYPPMNHDHKTLPYLDQWKWEKGHWAALLPTLEEQTRKGMYSKAISTRRKPARAPNMNIEPSIQSV